MTKKNESALPTITLPLMEAIEACSAVLGHISKDDVTPIITTAYLDGAYIVGTDRYTVGRFSLSAAATGAFLVPRAAVEWVARIMPRTLVASYAGSGLDGYAIRVTGPNPDLDKKETLKETVSVEVLYDEAPERMQRFHALAGNYPPVGRLIDEHKAAEEVLPVVLKPEMVERVTRYAKKWHRGEGVKFLMGASTIPSKPGPVRVTIGKFDGLIQPNLMLR